MSNEMFAEKRERMEKEREEKNEEEEEEEEMERGNLTENWQQGGKKS